MTHAAEYLTVHKVISVACNVTEILRPKITHAAMPTGRLRACKTSFGLLPLFLLLVPYNKQFNNLDRSVANRKPRPTVLISLSLGQYGKASV